MTVLAPGAITLSLREVLDADESRAVPVTVLGELRAASFTTTRVYEDDRFWVEFFVKFFVDVECVIKFPCTLAIAKVEYGFFFPFRGDVEVIDSRIL